MQIRIDKETVLTTLKRQYCFSGRSTRKEFWLTVLGLVAADILIVLLALFFGLIGLGTVGGVLAAVLFLAVAVAGVANTFRRVHDLGLSGFWLVYLSAFGLPCLYLANIMDVDESAKNAVSRIKAVGSPWLSWLLAIFLWPVASGFGLLLIFLSPGQKADNPYGANPYK